MLVGCRLAAVDDAANRAFKKGVHRVVELRERHEGVFVFTLYLLCRLLEAGEHGTLAAGEVLATVAVLAYFGEYFLYDDELVRHKRIGCGEFRAVDVAFDVQHSVVKVNRFFNTACSLS